jgi:hypothetical protein
MSRNTIISAEPKERSRLEVLYDGKPVNDPNIIVVRLGNTGKRAILAADFPDPIRLDFGSARVLIIQRMERSHPRIRATYQKDPRDASIVMLKPQLLNRREWFDLKFVTDGALKSLRLTSASQISPQKRLTSAEGDGGKVGN